MSEEDVRLDRALKVQQSVSIERGRPMPLGATLQRGGINFALFSRHATRVSLVLFEPGETRPLEVFNLDPLLNRTGNIWHAFIKGIHSGLEYGYLLDREPPGDSRFHHYHPGMLMLDPYARCITGGEEWGSDLKSSTSAERFGVRRGFITGGGFDWGDDRPLNRPMSETVIYELHVRGFTRHHSSNVAKPGTYAGLIEKIPYLKSLGVTAVELLPVYEFEESDTDRVNPDTGARLLNYWGYHPINFFAPNAAYAADNKRGAQVREFKTMVKAFHAAGLEVILDVVFNHTAEGDSRGPTFSLRGIDNEVYYLLDPVTGEYANYSGCGNTVNCNHPVVRDLIKDCLHYWVCDMHIDGFRFDLASVLGRGRDGSVLSNPPLLERIAADPVLADTKLIAEAWDAAGLYQVGTFPAWRRWAEWNGKFRDDIRRFVKSDPGMVPALANRLLGSPDLYRQSGRSPVHSINFITCHDGFTLRDLVSYDQKHNRENGEDNRDGQDDNLSWNCGCEGPVMGEGGEAIERLRLRQAKNFVTLLLLSRGVPMILAGDEFGRTQRGNNNAYCQDNGVSWVNWNLAPENAGLERFFRELIAFRQSVKSFRHGDFGNGDACECEVSFNGSRLGDPDWSWESRSLATHYVETCEGRRREYYLVANAWWEPLAFDLPALDGGRRWRLKINTMADSPADIYADGREPEAPDQKQILAAPRSIILLSAK